MIYMYVHMYMYNLASITLLDQSKLLQTEGLLVVKNYFAFISHTLFLFFPLLNIIFHWLLGISHNVPWSSLLTSPPTPSCTHLLPTIVASSLLFFCPCSHWSTVKLLVASPLKRSESFPSSPVPSICGELHFSVLITIFKSSLGGFLFRMLLFGGWGWRLGVVTETFYVPLCHLWVCSPQDL